MDTRQPRKDSTQLKVIKGRSLCLGVTEQSTCQQQSEVFQFTMPTFTLVPFGADGTNRIWMWCVRGIATRFPPSSSSLASAPWSVKSDLGRLVPSQGFEMTFEVLGPGILVGSGGNSCQVERGVPFTWLASSDVGVKSYLLCLLP